MLAVFSILVVVHSAFLFFYSFYGYWGGSCHFVTRLNSTGEMGSL